MSRDLHPVGVPTGHVFRVDRVRGPAWYAKYRLPDGKLWVAVGGAAAQVWNGRAWKLRRIPAARGGGLTGVSCPTAGACVLVGSDRTGGHTVSLIETYG
jgi:hypothetical protein